MLFAAQEWQQARADHTELPVNIVMLIEGEEECDSEGFVEVVERNMSWFNNVMVVLLANTYWIGEDTVCLKC
jgi:di- and tripeptidase